MYSARKELSHKAFSHQQKMSSRVSRTHHEKSGRLKRNCYSNCYGNRVEQRWIRFRRASNATLSNAAKCTDVQKERVNSFLASGPLPSRAGLFFSAQASSSRLCSPTK